MTEQTGRPALRVRGGTLRYGRRTVWSGLDLDVAPGEFIAVLGGNGSGKTSLLRAILGLQPLAAGEMSVAGRDIGYVQQQRRIDPLTPMRGRDIVRQGLDGHRWGIGRPGRATARVRTALEEVGAVEFADAPVGMLSGGEQQRLRVAQALVAEPPLLLCDEPLLSLDPASQRAITALVDRQRRRHRTAVLFVTHEITPVLPYVDRVLYLASNGFCIGTVDEVLNSTTLSQLYGAPVEVVRAAGQILIAGLPEPPQDHHLHDHPHESDHAHDHDDEPAGRVH